MLLLPGLWVLVPLLLLLQCVCKMLVVAQTRRRRTEVRFGEACLFGV